MNASYDCLICGKPVEDYQPTFCCNGTDCACGGHPTEPCVCSKQCDDALFRGIGKSMENRRLDANILRHDFKSDFHTYLELAGFVEADAMKDFGDSLVGVSYYVKKVVGNIHQYVLLSFYRDEFCEGVFWVYAAPRNERLKSNNTLDAMKRGGIPVSATIFRSLSDMVNVELSGEYLSDFVNTTFRQLEQKIKSQSK